MRPLSRCLKRFTVVFKWSIYTPQNFFRTIACHTAILGRRLSIFSTVNLQFLSYGVSKWAEFYPHYKYDIFFFIGLFYEKGNIDGCNKSLWGGGGFPGNGLTRSGATSRHIERGGLGNDSECTSVHVCYVKRRLRCVELRFVATSSSTPPPPCKLQTTLLAISLKSISFSEL